MQIQNFFAQDVNGNIVPGATCTLYIAGTTVLATGLQDSSGNPLANPFFADSNGLAAFAAPNGAYDLHMISGLLSFSIKVQFIDVVQVSADAATASAASTSAAASAISAAESAASASTAIATLLADLGNTTDPLKGAAEIGRAAVCIASVKDLLAAKREASQALLVAAYHPGVYALANPTISGGSGTWHWDANTPKSAHNGGTIISPTVPWDGTQATLGAFLAGTGETAPGTNGCFALSLQGDLWGEQFGAIGDNASDNGPSFHAATKYIESNSLGGTLRFGLGQFRTSSSIVNDRSANINLGKVSFVGSDENGTQIIYTGSSDCFLIKNNQTAAGEGSASYQRISNMTIIKSGGPGASSGITMDLAAWPKFERLNIQGFDFGMYLQDVDHPYFSTLNIRFNNKGIFSRKSPVPGASSTMPNNYTFISCSIGNNGTYGMHIIGGSAINWYGGSLEYNGHAIGASGFGIKLQDCGYEGGVGANFHGIYIEANNGIADIIIQGQNATDGPIIGCLHKISCDFHRNSIGANVNNIVTLFGPTASVGFQSLDVRGSSFKSFGGYVPNSATKNIAFGDTAATQNNFFDNGAYYGDAVERPAFSQNLNRYYASLAKNTNQTVSSSAWTKYLMDTVLNSFIYVPTLTTNDVTVPESALYTISATITFAANTSGARAVRLKVGSVVVASADISAAIDNAVTVTRTRRINVGAVVSVEVFQSSGVALDVLAPASGESLISITKEVGQ